MVLTEKKISSVLELIKKCGLAILGAHDIENAEDDIASKYGVANFVTVYDVRTQNSLIDGLKTVFPEACFFAEEKDNSLVDYKTSVCFFIDPIDGTTNFIHDMRMSAVSVAMCECGETVFGAVYNPYSDEMFWAVKGKGAFLNGRRINVSDRSLDKALVMFGTAPYDREELADELFRVVSRVFMKCADIRRSGSAALDICSIACGRGDVFIEPVLSPWDFMAGKLIVEEAGGRVSSYDGGELAIGARSSVLCTNKVLHSEMLGLINKE